ncbi:MAG: DUF962 domain-containing protein [Planctomycetia bacterium]|nr:DUF962 domain-containing protein [Planctomycetia bacterium]
MSYRFPIARKLLAFARRARRNWLDRHQNSANFWIHMLGIPLAVAGLVLLFVVPWYWGVGAIVVGYALQWIGHRIEGNDVGEFIPLKRLLGLPVVAVAPRYVAKGDVPESSHQPEGL